MDNKETVFNSIETLPVLPLRGLVVMPGTTIHFDVARKRSVAALEFALKNNKSVLCVAQRDISVEHPNTESLYEVGTVIHIKQLLRLPGEGLRILVEGVGRAKILSLSDGRRLLSAEVVTLNEEEPPTDTAEVIALSREIKQLFEEFVSSSSRLSPDVLYAASSIALLGKLCDFVAANIPLTHEDKQELLESENILQRAALLIALVDREIEILSIEQDINEKVKEQMDKNQRDYFMREQIKVIRGELGEDSGFDADADKFIKRINKLPLSAEIKGALLAEAKNLARMSFGSAEGTVVRNYLETCLSLPWTKTTKEKLSIERARGILEKEHFGLEKVKDRVLQFIAVKKLTPGLGGQVLCLIGPPGVGKTSVASSVAHAMGRKFVRISLGGVRDEADIRGHRKTYVGSMPGRIITALKKAGTKNPVILLDEVDKMSSDYRGDPSAALLEVFDAEQNHAFTDHYIELPFDLSDVVFIATANTADTIPRPLLDRMEKIEVASYTDNEKVEIAKRHLVPKQLKRHGLRASELKIPEETIRRIIEAYTRESGVRGLERQIGTICRKTALYKVESGVEKYATRPDDLCKLLGAPKYMRDSEGKNDEVGIANGLAWTAVGGECLKIEVSAVPGSGKIELTGSLGEIMKESAKAALTYIRSRSSLFAMDDEFYKTKDIHIHIPEGAVKKDGPSAGVTMLTALLSELTGVAVKGDVAMTGEVTLRGRVLPIGGLREKTMAALKNGYKTVFIPKENVPDLDEIDQSVREKLDFIPVASYDEMIDKVFICNVHRGASKEEPLKTDGRLENFTESQNVAILQQ